MRIPIVCFLGVCLGVIGASAAGPAGDELVELLDMENPASAVATPAVAAAAGDLAAENAALKAEVERLKDYIRRILAANRRERTIMHYNIGCVYKAGGQFKKAEEEWLKALAVDEKDAAVHYNLGILYEDDLRQPEKAKTHYRRFLDLAPDDPDANKVQEWLTLLR